MEGNTRNKYAGSLQDMLRPHIKLLEREGVFKLLGEDAERKNLGKKAIDFLVQVQRTRELICIECDYSGHHVTSADIERDELCHANGYHVIRLNEDDIIKKKPSDFILSEVRRIQDGKETETHKRALGKTKGLSKKIENRACDSLFIAIRRNASETAWACNGRLIETFDNPNRASGVEIGRPLSDSFSATILQTDDDLEEHGALTYTHALKLLLPVVVERLVTTAEIRNEHMRIYITDKVRGLTGLGAREGASRFGSMYGKRWSQVNAATSLYPFIEHWQCLSAEPLHVRTDMVRDMALDERDYPRAAPDQVLCALSAECRESLIALNSAFRGRSTVASKDAPYAHFPSYEAARAEANRLLRKALFVFLPNNLQDEKSVGVDVVSALAGGCFNEDRTRRAEIYDAIVDMLLREGMAKRTRREDINPTSLGEGRGIQRLFIPGGRGERAHPIPGFDRDGLAWILPLIARL